MLDLRRRRLAAAVAEVLPDVIVEHLPAAVRPRREPEWKRNLLLAGAALGACLAAATALVWISRQTGQAVDKIAFNYPYDDEESWFV